MPIRVLFIEDEPDLVPAMEYTFGREGMTLVHAANARAGLTLAKATPPPDLVLLDLNLPDLSGTEVCRRLKADPTTRQIPVVMLTARGEEIDRVVGFELGADDYVVKPFSMRELVLRLQAVLRRAQPPAEPTATTLRFGLLTLDLQAHRAWVDGEEVQLTALDFQLLLTLHARKGRVQSRDTLLTDVWGVHGGAGDRTVDSQIKRLRRKLGGAGQYVETVRGVGYRMVPEPD